MKTWNLGNTTVRNPARIKEALRVFKDTFEGREFDIPTQNEFYDALLENKIIKGKPKQSGSRAWSARKWASAFNKLGLAMPRGTKENPVTTITMAGNALLDTNTIDQDVFLRQMLKIQLPSPTEKNLDNASVHPFFFILSVAINLHEEGMSSLTKEEIALYIQSANNDRQVDEVIESIKQYRRNRGEISGLVAKRRYFQEELSTKVLELYSEVTPQKKKTLVDYSDTTIRYSVISGIFTIGRQSLVIKENQVNLARKIVDMGIPDIVDRGDFLAYFHDPLLPILPTDDADFLINDIEALELRLNNLSLEVDIERKHTVAPGDTILELRKKRSGLEDELLSLKEVKFYHNQSNVEEVQDIINVFGSIEKREIIGGSDYMPAWAEWAVWRVFLSIDTLANPVSESRNFEIDTELNPIHHARGGVSDLLFRYENQTIIPAEITLSSSERQFNMEGEPVKYHIKSVIEKNTQARVIGVFTAPEIHVATAHEFLNADFFSEKLGKPIELDIVPLSFAQLLSLLPGKNNGCNDATSLIQLLEHIIESKKRVSDGPAWLEQIKSLVPI